MSDAAPQERLRDLQKLSLTQVAPGVWRHTGNGSAPEIVIARVVPGADGTFRLVPAYEQWMRICAKNVRMLGMEGQWHTLTRLGRAGFVEIVQVSPSFHLLNLTTWWGHLARVAEDPEVWAKHTAEGKKRLKLYRENMF